MYNGTYENKAIQYADRYGIREYEIKQNQMIYTEVFPNEGTWKCTVDLETMKETRKQIKGGK